MTIDRRYGHAPLAEHMRFTSVARVPLFLPLQIGAAITAKGDLVAEDIFIANATSVRTSTADTDVRHLYFPVH